MDKKYFGRNIIRQIMEGRAARICAVAVTAFLCVLTLIEFTALELELEIPMLQVICGEHSIWSENYQREELALDNSKENEILEETNSQMEQNTSGEAENGDASGKDNATKAGDASGKNNSTKDADASGKSNGVKDADASGKSNSVKDADVAGKVTVANELEKKDTAEKSKDGEASEEKEVELPYYIRVNRKQNCVTIYTQDERGEYTVPYEAMICSTGLYNATPRGTYHISTKYLWRDLYGGVYGQYATRIHGGILFHSVPYYKKSKSSLCTDKYNKLGQQASMGCVRLTVEDAKWIAENCPAGTTVEIYDDEDPGPLGKPEAVKIDTDSPIKGWDPTDPDIENPWNEVSEDE